MPSPKRRLLSWVAVIAALTLLACPLACAPAADTYIAYRRDWANVSNTPFREYKHWVHEGGIATPLIVHWPPVSRPAADSAIRPDT